MWDTVLLPSLLLLPFLVAGNQPTCNNSSQPARCLHANSYQMATDLLAFRRLQTGNSHSLIGPFDISKLFIKKKQRGHAGAQTVDTHHPEPELLHSTSKANFSIGPPAPAALAGQQQRQRQRLQEQAAWPVKRAAILEGDIVLGGLMTVHRRSERATCGRVMAPGGVQALEAMLYALDMARDLTPPGFRLGAHVLDDCDNDTYGLEVALDFIKGSIGNIDDEQYACNGTVVRKTISGVVGASSSATSVQIANLLRLFKIPQVSFFSTSPELSNKARFEYFTRTIPSDLHQVRAMVEIVKKFGWRYVSVIYEESNYGIKAFEELESLLARNEICIAVKERLPKDSGEADEHAYDSTVARLLTRPRARGVIVFGSDKEVAGVMAAVVRLGATRTFAWVGSDGWSARPLVSDGNELAVEGTISVQPHASPVRGFAEYFLNLTVENNSRNPWFIEFWEEQFRCRYPGGAATPYNVQYSRLCTGREQLSPDNTVFEAQLQFVTDAVLAFAHAVSDMHSEVCGGQAGLCAGMLPVSGPDLLQHLRRVRFTGLSGHEFHFDLNGDGPARYNILHFKQVALGEFRWLRVGQYLDGELKLNMNEFRFKWDEPRPPESVCSADCELGQAKQYVEGERCCWHCYNCSRYEVVSLRSESCSECAYGSLPDPARRTCVLVPERIARPAERFTAAALAVLGLASTAAAAGAWAARSSTPLVRASGRELSFVLLAGIALCYLVTLALLFQPTDFLCALQRFGAGFSFTVVYAAVLTKTNRIARIFTAMLVSVQVILAAVWQLVSPARAVRHHPTREYNMLVCDSYVDSSYTIAFLYPVLLIVTCTVHAVLTRNIPETFNESKHIGFTMYTTCVIWFAFVPLYFGTAHHLPLRVTSMAITISLSASVTLVCLFAPKMYIIVVRPERNVRTRLMPSRWRGPAGCAGGAVCAALVGSATVPRASDLSALQESADPPTSVAPLRQHRSAQTDELAGRLPAALLLDAQRLLEDTLMTSGRPHHCDLEPSPSML